MDEGDSVDEAPLSEEAPCRGPQEGAPSLRTLEDMLRILRTRTALSMGALFHLRGT